MINTGLEMPDMVCTAWANGIPKWLGGTGVEWLHCCIEHDLGASDIELFQCVVKSGFPVMGLVMLFEKDRNLLLMDILNILFNKNNLVIQ